MIIKTSNVDSIEPFINKLILPKSNSHKGQNGKILIIGGSSLFHAASIWSAEIASHFSDMVHYCSTKENNEIFISVKKKFRNGIVVDRKNLLDYVEEDDVVLVGPGLVRGKISNIQYPISNYSDLLEIKFEAEYTYQLTKYLLKNFPRKKFVLDAGALQMMDPNWLLELKIPAIVTPHQGEFKQLFGFSVNQFSVAEKEKIRTVENYAKKYNCTIILKAITDFISDGEKSAQIKGGNAGLTKGGTGDVLAGLTASFFAKNDSFISGILASYILKKSAEELFLQKGYWYNVKNIIDTIPDTLNNLITAK